MKNKNRKLGYWMAVCCLLTLSVQTLIVPREAKAIASLVLIPATGGLSALGLMGAVPLLLHGLADMAFNCAPGEQCQQSCNQDDFDCGSTGYVLGVIQTVGGIILLKGEDNNVHLTKISPAYAASIGNLSEKGVQAYNDELPELDAIRETVTQNLIKDSMNSHSKHQSLKLSRMLWSRYSGLVSPEAFETLQAVIQHEYLHAQEQANNRK